MPDNAEVDPRKKLDAEVKRLYAKRKETNDRDIRAALDLAIKDREDELNKLGGPIADADPAILSIAKEREPEPIPEELPEAPTPEAKLQAEKLIQQSRLELRRGNGARASELLDEAVRIAPGASDVQEMVGDGYLERKQYKAALARYNMARKLDPKNVSADKKHAELVFQTQASSATAVMSLEYQRDQMVTSAQKAAIFSLILPGSGQILLGESVYGGWLMGGWGALVFWVFLWNEEVKGILQGLGMHIGKVNPHPNYAVLFPIFGALLIHVISVFSAAAEGMAVKMPTKVDRPAPPVDLPFD